MCITGGRNVDYAGGLIAGLRPLKTLPFAAFQSADNQPVEGAMDVFSGDVVPRQLNLPVGVNQFCRFTSLAWPRCWAALVR